MEARESSGKTQAHYSETFPLPFPFWTGPPAPEALPALASILAPFFQNQSYYRTLQVSLPDAAARWEVFEMEKVPAAGEPLEKFLNWRFNPHSASAEPLVFTSQVLGGEKNKKLLLGVALPHAWLQLVRQAFEVAGGRMGVMDLASRFRFNWFHETFLPKGSGALVSLERDYWTLLIWDDQTRPRFQRSKWWGEPLPESRGLALDEVVLETERTIRSYVHSGPDRSVENLFLLAPETWRDRALQAFHPPTEGRVLGLSLEPLLEAGASSHPGLSPSLAATAVRQ
jgi:hypothetical protein